MPGWRNVRRPMLTCSPLFSLSVRLPMPRDSIRTSLAPLLGNGWLDLNA